jgi:hypothetical protein
MLCFSFIFHEIKFKEEDEQCTNTWHINGCLIDRMVIKERKLPDFPSIKSGNSNPLSNGTNPDRSAEKQAYIQKK